jgi:mitochondrial chaperone BCS1
VWDHEDDSDLATVQASPEGYLDFSNQAVNIAPRFTPAPGSHSFHYNGRYFKLERKKDTLANPGARAQGMPQYTNKETLVLSCPGRSPEPIKQLLQHAKEQYYESCRRTDRVRPAAA